MIELTINDKKVLVEPNTTVLQAALKNDIYIPHLCYDKRLAPYGGCRLCLVEVEGQRKLLASCSTPAEAGMVVRTETPALYKARGTVLELLLVHHPLDCPACDKAGECDLQDMVYRYGRPKGRFIRHRKDKPSDVRGPLIELNSNRCVLCGKCVRICAEYQGRGALGLIGRGFPTVVQSAFGESLECDYCGQCVDICPTGALLAKPYKFQARPWFLEEKDTICPFCGCGCTLTVGMKEGMIVRSRGREGVGVSDGNLCGRGRFGFDYIYSENRLKTPLIRINGQLVPASWQEALTYIAQNLKIILNTHGPASVGAIGSPRCTNEDNYMLSKFMRTVVGTDNMDSSAYFGYRKTQDAFYKGFGVKAPPARLDSPLRKNLIFVIESDFTITHPVFGLNLLKAKRNGSTLIVADSKETKLTHLSTRWLRLKPGTAHALLNAMAKILIEESLFDRTSAKDTSNLRALESFLKKQTLEKAAEITGIPKEDIISLAKDLAVASSRMMAMSLGVSENTKGINTVLSAINLLILLGEGPEALQIPAEYANTYGLYKVGVRPDMGVQHGKDIKDMLYTPGSLNAMYIMGEDPAVNFPDASQVVESLKGLDFLIVQDIALTETAKLAHVVLPAAGWAEKDGTFMNAEGLLQKIFKLVEAPGQSLPDWQIIRNLAMVMGKDIGAKHLDSLKAEVSEWLKNDYHEYNGLLFNPEPFTAYPDAGGDYPLVMVTRDLLQHSGSMSSRSRSLDLVVADSLVEINREDAAKYGIKDGTHIKVTSERGSIYLKGKVSESVPEGVICVPTHFPHARVNLLTHNSLHGEAPLEAVRVAPAGTR